MSNIEWTDATWNPVVGCTPVSEGCRNCYAATMARRLEAMGVAEYAPTMFEDTPGDDQPKVVRIAELRGGRAVFTGDVRLVEHRLTEPLKWRKPRRVFVNSMSDLFHPDVPFAFIDKVFAVMALCPQHTFQVLTKRPERMAEYLNGEWVDGLTRQDAVESVIDQDPKHFPCAIDWPLPNVWLGTSVENQASADERIPHLLRCRAAVRFLSCEPLLGAVNVRKVAASDDAGYMAETPVWLDAMASTLWSIHGEEPTVHSRAVGWVIIGGESGTNARPCNIAWIRAIVSQCKAAGVPCFVKQLGTDSRGLDCPECGNAGEVVAGRNELSMAICPRCDGTDRVRLRDRKGGDMQEWPEDLRVREFPAVGGAA